MGKEELLDQAIKSYQEKLKQNPGSLLFVQLADAYRKKGMLDEAEAACADGMKRNPELLSGMLMMGRIHLAKRNPGGAAEVLKRVTAKEPNNLTSHALLSQAYISQGKYPEAIAEYQKILSLNPEDSAAQQALQAALDKMRKEGKEGREEKAAKPRKEEAVSAPPAGGGKAAESPPEPQAMEVPALAAADELTQRGLYDEAVEAYQRIVEADPDNFMARQKLREVYAMREATDTPVAPSPPMGRQEVLVTEADKISDDEILYLLGLMEGGTAETPPPVPAGAPKSEETGFAPRGPRQKAEAPPPAPPPAPEPKPEPVPEPEPAAKAEPEPAPAAKAEPEPEPAAKSEPEPKPKAKAKAKAEPKPEPEPEHAPKAEAPAAPAVDEAKVTEILGRLAQTEGVRRAFLLAGEKMISAGKDADAKGSEKMATPVKMLADVTKRAAAHMKHGEARQVLVFGTEGILMVSQAVPGILAAVAGAGVKIGLLRLALNDCLKRLSEVS